MPATLQDIMNELKDALKVFDQWSVAHAVGDGVSVRYKLPDYPVIDPDTLLCVYRTTAEAGATPETTTLTSGDYDLDPIAGWFALDTAAPAGAAIQWTWKWAQFDERELINLVNAGVRYVSKEVKIEGLFDESTSTELFTYEYPAPVGATRIKKVELTYDNEYNPWVAYPYWETINKDGLLYVKFTRHPGIMWCRMWYDADPTGFAGLQENDEYAEELVADTGLPEAAYDPIIHYVVWIALHRAVTYRSRDDAVQHAKEETTVTMRDLESRVAASKALFDLHMSRFASELDHSRIIG